MTETIPQLRSRISQNLTQATPVEIDTVLAPIWEREANAQMRIANYQRGESEIFATIEKIKKGERVLRVSTALDGIELMEKLALLGRHIVAEWNNLAAAQSEAAPYETEYTRRGGWNRVYLATSHDGHAHRGTECSSCHHGDERTSFYWLVRYSGKAEEEIVSDAGERACTACYKSAPVNVLKQKTKMFTPDEVEAQAAREAREAERARKAAEVEAKGITTPEGDKLYAGKDNASYDVCKSLRTAEIAATDALLDIILDRWRATQEDWAFRFERKSLVKFEVENAAHAGCLLRAIAHKKGQSLAEVFEIHNKKAEAKFRKMQRDWANDPRNR
jgi:hypothetical protein